jgi:hypothetical protein
MLTVRDEIVVLLVVSLRIVMGSQRYHSQQRSSGEDMENGLCSCQQAKFTYPNRVVLLTVSKTSGLPVVVDAGSRVGLWDYRSKSRDCFYAQQ